MALYSGKTGYIKIGTGEVAKIVAHMSSFSIDLSTEIIEVVAFGNTYKEKIPSIMDWTASADGNCDFATDSGQYDLYTAYTNGTLVTIGLGLTEDTYFEGTAYISSLAIENSSDGSPTVAIEFSGSNALTFSLGE